MGGEAKSKSSPIRKEVPKEETQVSSLKDPVVPRCAAPTPPAKDSKPSFGESATQFAKGFAHGVSEESRQLYNDTKELPSQLAKAGTELAEDLKSGRELRALAPLRAASHAIRNASRKDVERIAHAVVDGAKEWLEKPAYEKGESLGRATTAIASEVAIDVLTEGIGTVATLRKVGKVAEAADHVRDAEKVVERAAHAVDRADDAALHLRPAASKGQPVRDIDAVINERAAAAQERLRPASSAKQQELLGEHLRQHQRYGQERILPDGRQRYSGEVKPARTPGEMAGQRVTREWNPETGQYRTWQETVDHQGRIRQVRPEESRTGDKKVHYQFGPDGTYQRKW
jgi:hypothetical protein